MPRPSFFLWTVVSPTEWPPRELVVISKSRRATDGLEVEVLAGPDGRFTVRYELGEEREFFVFQPMMIVGPVNTWKRLSCGFNENRVELSFGGLSLLLDPDGQAPCAFQVNDPSAAPPPRELVLPDVDLAIANSRLEELFIRLLQDIDQAAMSDDWYELVKASGNLRQLFVDRSTLLDQVNQTYRKRLTFRILDPSQSARHLVSNVDAHWRVLDPTPFPSSTQVVEVSRDRFLQAEVMHHGGASASVRDLISACANAMGGVHHGPPLTPGERVVLKFNEVFTISEAEISLVGLVAVCRISLAAMRPLLEAMTAAKRGGQ